MPRYVGFPNQVWVADKFAFNSFEKTFKNKVPFFVSTFRFKNKETPIVDNLLFDIGSYYSIRFPYRNVRKLKNWCSRKDIPYMINGGKGFHFFLIIQNITPKTDIEKATTKDLMYSVQVRLAKEIGLETYDESTFGRIRFLVRYPTSMYIRKDDDTSAFAENGMYCRNLNDDEFDSGLKKIAKLAREPGIVPNKPTATKTLQQIADLFKDFKVVHRQESKNEEQLTLLRARSKVPSLKALGLPCLQEFCGHSHPTHYERIELVAWLKYLGYTDLAINAFIKRRNWTGYKYAVTACQVRTVKPRMVECTFLRKTYGDLCKNCPMKRGRK